MDNKNQEETITCPKCHELIPMKDTLDKEKKAMVKLWAEREKQIERVVHNTSGMCGDLL
jgi:hypothetical protein